MYNRSDTSHNIAVEQMDTRTDVMHVNIARRNADGR